MLGMLNVVHRQARQKHVTKEFDGFHNDFTVLTMVNRNGDKLTVSET